MIKFADPYEHLGKNDVINTSIEVSKSDHAYLLSIFPHRSVLQITVNILLREFVLTLKRKNIPHGYDPDTYRAAIANLNINTNLSGGGGGTATNDGASTERENKPVEASNRDDGRGTGSVVNKGQGLPAPAQHPSSASQGGGSDKDKAKSKKG